MLVPTKRHDQTNTLETQISVAEIVRDSFGNVCMVCQQVIYNKPCFKYSLYVSNVCVCVCVCVCAFSFDRMEEEHQWGSSRLPQNKKKLVEHTKRRYVKPMAPYQTDRKAKTSSSCDIDQKRFKCECCYCQRYMGSASGISTGRKATSHSSSWDELIQEVSMRNKLNDVNFILFSLLEQFSILQAPEPRKIQMF